jgi:predicted NBD/HSP70 family sugar kinase
MPLFFPAMDAYFRKHICPVPAQRTKIVKAGLGDYAGVIGAACVVLQKIKHQV